MGKSDNIENTLGPKVSIVVLNYNRFSLTSDCIRSLENLTYPNFEIIIVDNGSVDDSPSRLKEAFAHITLIRNEKSPGSYCAGLNIGIRKALEEGAGYIFILNNDTKNFSVDYLEEVLKVFESDKNIGVVGTKVVDFSGNIIWNGQERQQFATVTNIPDCGFIIRAEIFEKIGLFDENLVVYFEDFDFLQRVKNARYKTAFISSVQFAHLEGGTIKRLSVNFRPNYYMIRNAFLYARKHGLALSATDRMRWIWRQVKGRIRIIIESLGDKKDIKGASITCYAMIKGFIDGLCLLCRAKQPGLEIGLSALTKKEKITIFLCYFGGGGAERVLMNLAAGFLNEGFKIDLVLGSQWGPHLWKIPLGVRIIDLKAKGMLQTIVRLRHYLIREKPEVMLSGLHYASEIAIIAKKISRTNTRVVVTEHNTFSQALTGERSIRKRLLLFSVRHIYPLADVIVGVSQGAAEDLSSASGIPISRIKAIYNPAIMPDIFERAKETIDHPWFQQGQPPVILGIGKLESQKDFANLIRAFTILRKKKEARLVILGWGPGDSKEKLENLAEQLGVKDDVAMLGYVKNPYLYMAHSSVFVLSSQWEGLPTVIIEALALGVPVVSTDCPGGSAEILDNGKYGLLVPVGDSNALAEAILKVLDGERKEVDSIWLKQFTPEVIVPQYLDVLGIGGEK